MKLPIITYPDKQLKSVSKEVTNFDTELHTFLDDMFETMMGNNGIGLAAIQVARPIRALILCIPDEEGEQKKENLLEILNPLIKTPQGVTTYQEGCLSVPGFYEDIERFESLTLHYQDRHGKECTLEANELLAIAIQHEMDHLEGKLFIEKLTYNRRKKFEKEYKKALKEKK
ncbi:MAG: peptide deformylase [Sulfuricurvum sp.]|uniref:peptide deformylase n=1 Tax=Sulfuricurvum sp. TaxID=2025608 RepID=UPI0026095C4D|nr:peptide deformylase [Sulfuricurvum sp.]MDD2828405.1 peptide deformylase [Sulfuricurvum sp.]MDD4949410.1 peptide deformylase [Sulfuricurvum sp.]